MKISKESVVRFFKFLVFSLGAGIIQIGSFAILYDVLHFDYWLSYLPSLVLSVLFNFTVNKSYTFKSADNVPKCMLLVFLFYCVFTPVTTVGGTALEVSGWDGNIVMALTMVLNFVLEFLYCRYVVYRNTIDTKKN